VLLAAGAGDLAAATRLLDGADQNLRKALAKLGGGASFRRMGT
jgi:hypothetical protein